jgi:hypothetical protein
MRGPAVGICEWCQSPATSGLDFLEVRGVRKTVCMACQDGRLSQETSEEFARRVLAEREWPCMAPGCNRTTSVNGRGGWTAEVTLWKGIKRVLCPEHQ